ncbi:PepSY domain-containing protein [Nitrospira sp. M1]
MRTEFHEWGRQPWHSPGEIVEGLQRQHYHVYAIECEDHWYAVNAYDPQGAQVELKVNPKTREIFSWIIRSPNINNQKFEEGLWFEEGVVTMPEATVTISQELVCL